MLKRFGRSAGTAPLICSVLLAAAVTGAATTERITVSVTADPVDGYSTWPGISDDGSLISFQSAASNLVDVDGDGVTATISTLRFTPVPPR